MKLYKPRHHCLTVDLGFEKGMAAITSVSLRPAKQLAQPGIVVDGYSI